MAKSTATVKKTTLAKATAQKTTRTRKVASVKKMVVTSKKH
jgi:hypothetical protein